MVAWSCDAVSDGRYGVWSSVLHSVMVAMGSDLLCCRQWWLLWGVVFFSAGSDGYYGVQSVMVAMGSGIKFCAGVGDGCYGEWSSVLQSVIVAMG